MRPVISLLGGLILFAAGATTALSAPGDSPQGEPVKLTYIWQPGMTTYHRMTMTMESKSVTDGTGKEHVFHDRMAMMYRMEVYSVRDDGTARVATTMLRSRREHDDPTKGANVYDSANPAGNKDAMESGIYGSMVNKTIIMEITTDGRVQQIQGLDDLVQTMTKESGKSDPSFAKYLEESGFAKRMKQMLQESVSQTVPSEHFLSTTPRRVGEQWPASRTMNLPTGDEMTSNDMCKLEAVEVVAGRRIARISMSGKHSMKALPPSPGAAKPAVPTPSHDMSGSVESVYLFDLERGRYVRWETHSTSTGRFGATTIGTHTLPGSEMKSNSTMLMELVGPEDSIDPQSEGMKGKTP